jgi:choline kinase/phosphatidylglycerophosphate synthase
MRPTTRGRPKSLIEIAQGVTLLQAGLTALQGVGADEFVVVVRPDHEELFAQHLPDGVRLGPVGVKGEFGNLVSVLKGLELARGDYIIVAMSDHLYEEAALRRLLALRGAFPLALCLDRRPRSRDLEEGLRVRVQGSRVTACGKGLPPPFEGVDIGLFLIDRGLLGVVREVVRDKGPAATIADLVNRLAVEGRVGFVDVTGLLWWDVDTPEDLEVARRLYWEVVRRGLVKPTDGPVSRYLNRPLSTRLSVMLARKGVAITPNQVTTLSFGLALLAGYLFATRMLIVGGLVTHLSSVIDGVDGELARIRGLASKFGAFYDSILDRIADLALIVGLVFPLVANPVVRVLGLLAAAGVVLVSYASHLASPRVAERLRQGPPWATRDVRLLALTLGGLMQEPLLPLLWCAITPYIFLVRALYEFKREAE